jgi:hypothetical protein
MPLISSLCSFLHSPVTSSILGPNILVNAIFQLNVSLCCTQPSKRTYLRSILNDSFLFYCTHFCFVKRREDEVATFCDILPRSNKTPHLLCR